jgi:hypothetical protein
LTRASSFIRTLLYVLAAAVLLKNLGNLAVLLSAVIAGGGSPAAAGIGVLLLATAAIIAAALSVVRCRAMSGRVFSAKMLPAWVAGIVLLDGLAEMTKDPYLCDFFRAFETPVIMAAAASAVPAFAGPARLLISRLSGSDRGQVVLYGSAASLLLAAYLLSNSFRPVCFDDCLSYLHLMGENIISPVYWQSLFSMYRSFAVPVIFSVFGPPVPRTMTVVVVFQALLQFSAWVAFAAAVSGFIERRPVRFAVFVLVSCCMFSRGYYNFNRHLLSDSITMSLVLLWLVFLIRIDRLADLAVSRAAGVLQGIPPGRDGGAVRRAGNAAGSALLLLSLVFLTVFTSFARDTNAFLVVFGIPVVIWRLGSAHRTGLAVLASACLLAVPAVQQFASNSRHTLNIANIIAGVVMQKPEMRAYFEDRGMRLSPAPPALKALEKRDADSMMGDVGFLLGEFSEARDLLRKELAPDFIRNRGRAVYAAYLLENPGHVYGNLVRYQNLIFRQSLAEKDDCAPCRAAGFSPSVLAVSGRLDFKTYATALCAIAALYLLARRRPPALVLLGMLIAAAGFANALIGFHGDFWEQSEMKRHTLIGSILFETGGFVALLGFLADMERRTCIFQAKERICKKGSA